jgi:hypothetical protein
MIIKQSPVDYAVVVTGTLLSMSLQYQDFLESDLMPNETHNFCNNNLELESAFQNEWDDIIIGKSNMKTEITKQLELPSFKNNYKVKIRVKNAGRLQLPRFSNEEKIE